jgi:hypothetical protein
VGSKEGGGITMGANRAFKRRQQRELVQKGLKTLKASRRAFKKLLATYGIKPTLSNQAKNVTEMLEGSGHKIEVGNEQN